LDHCNGSTLAVRSFWYAAALLAFVRLGNKWQTNDKRTSLLSRALNEKSLRVFNNKKAKGCPWMTAQRRHDIQQNDTQRNDTLQTRHSSECFISQLSNFSAVIFINLQTVMLTVSLLLNVTMVSVNLLTVILSLVMAAKKQEETSLFKSIVCHSIRHNNTQHKGLICKTQHKWHSAQMTVSKATLPLS
jgi:hypothetical protein